LQSALGLYIMFTRGNSEEARGSLLRGLELAEQQGDLRNQLRVLEKLHVFHQRIGDCHEAFALARRSQSVANGLGDATSLTLANWTLGFSNYFAGNSISAEAHWGASSMQQDGSGMFGHKPVFDYDAHARSRCGLGAVRWIRGFPDQAVKIVRDTIKEGAALKDPSTLCICLIFTSFTLLRIGDWVEAERMIERLGTHAKKYSLAPYEAIGVGLRGALLIGRGEAQAGVGLVSRAIETLHVGRYELHNPAFLGTLAEGLVRMGRFEAALIRIDEALGRIEKNGQLVFLPEFLRIKGTILMAAGHSDLDQAEELFFKALETANRQSALAWELRAATSAAELRLSQRRNQEAREILAPVYGRYSEGFESADLKKGRAVLEVSRE
jgi:tetratricopeptide (TPR) repeat protein